MVPAIVVFSRSDKTESTARFASSQFLDEPTIVFADVAFSWRHVTAFLSFSFLFFIIEADPQSLIYVSVISVFYVAQHYAGAVYAVVVCHQNHFSLPYSFLKHGNIWTEIFHR